MLAVDHNLSESGPCHPHLELTGEVVVDRQQNASPPVEGPIAPALRSRAALIKKGPRTGPFLSSVANLLSPGLPSRGRR
jgi:hypothetical protein